MAEDNHSKYVLTIVGIVVIFALVVMLLPKPTETRTSRPTFAAEKEKKFTSPYSFTSTQLGTRCKYIANYKVTFSPAPPNHHCPGTHTIDVEMSMIVDWILNPGEPRPSGCPKFCMDGVMDPDGDGQESKDELCGDILTAMRTFCRDKLCSEANTGVKYCKGKLSQKDYDQSNPYRDRSGSRVDDCGAKGSWNGLICDCYIESPPQKEKVEKGY